MKRPGFLSCSFFAFGLGLGAAHTLHDPAVLELKDGNGIVRCRLGRLGEGEEVFGFDLFDAKGKRKLRAMNEESGTLLVLNGPTPSSTFRIDTFQDGAALSIGPDDKDKVFFGRNSKGALLLQHGDKEDMSSLWLRSDPNAGSVVLRLATTTTDDNLSGVQLRADKRGALVETVRDGGTGAQLVSATGVGSVLQVGAKERGIYLQALDDGTSTMTFSREKPVLTLQNSKKSGVGIGIDRPDGGPALRLGLTPDGEFHDRTFDADGKPTDRR